MEMDTGFFNSLLTMKKKKPMNSSYSQLIPLKPTLNAKDYHIATTVNTYETTLSHTLDFQEIELKLLQYYSAVVLKSKTPSLNESLYQQWLDARKPIAHQSMPNSSLDSEKVSFDTSLKGTCETQMENQQALKIGEAISSHLNTLNGYIATHLYSLPITPQSSTLIQASNDSLNGTSLK